MMMMLVLAVVVVVGGGGGGCVGVTPAAFFLGSVVAGESSNRWCFRVFLQLAEQKPS